MSNRARQRAEAQARLAHPITLNAYRNHAAEIVTDAVDRLTPSVQADWDELSDEQREGYIDYMIELLTPALLAFVIDWATNSAPSISDWLDIRSVVLGKDAERT